MTPSDPDPPRPHDAAPAQPQGQGRQRTPHVVRRRDPDEMTAEERAFVARHRLDMPPHHDSAWG